MILRILLTLGFLPLALLKGTSVSVGQSPVLVVYDSVNLTCNCNCKETTKEFRASLRRGASKSVEICAGSFNISYQSFESNDKISCFVVKDEEKVTFHLRNLNVNHTDIYFCKLETMYPPPYLYTTDNGTVIHVKEKLFCEPPKPFLLMVALVGMLVFYSVLMTAAGCYCWQKSKKTKLHQSDYMNTTPRRPNKYYQPYIPTRGNPKFH
ncbi:T-cell-specific surface glycoprotein CD28 [Microcaecilia unicolor]|uniref:T-cell-specific surface glycoprotein CD28 n=1 Tax=Microcaecilia unicolor TaxID=1415580 RepID=A0A6P7YKL7_9AMPH|nr:T-cell-specific surface glycoprotein CD28 [Microcaecilia unicolor]